ncbi:hypothetical protein [Methylobacterium sp. Gmos1]
MPESGGEITTGVRLDADELRKWSGWTSLARAYLDAAGDEINIENFVEEYVSKVNEIQILLSKSLIKFHANEISELEALREEYALSEGQADISREDNLPEGKILYESPEKIIDDFYIPISIVDAINQCGERLLSNIRALIFEAHAEMHFRSERPVNFTITPAELIEQPVISRKDAEGNEIIAFISQNSQLYGFDAVATDIFYKTVDVICKIDWAQKKLDEKFIRSLIIDWCRSSFASDDSIGLAASIISSAKSNIKLWDVWAPIAYLEVERGFSLGPAQILPIRAQMLTDLEEEGIKFAAGQEDQVHALFNSLRSTMQGYAAVVIKIEAVRERAKLDGLAIAREAINLLRFFSPAASDISLYCPTSLLGSEIIPTSHVLVLGSGDFSYSESGPSDRVAYWQMSNGEIEKKERALDAVGKLFDAEYLSEFERAVRSAIIIFGTAATFRNLDDRLIYTLSAVENLLLKHESEARAYNVEKRLTQLMAYGGNKTEEVAHVIRATYRFRARHGMLQWSDFERSLLQEFVRYAQSLIIVALHNTSNFSTCSEFIDGI